MLRKHGNKKIRDRGKERAELGLTQESWIDGCILRPFCFTFDKEPPYAFPW